MLFGRFGTINLKESYFYLKLYKVIEITLIIYLHLYLLSNIKERNMNIERYIYIYIYIKVITHYKYYFILFCNRPRILNIFIYTIFMS